MRFFLCVASRRGREKCRWCSSSTSYSSSLWVDHPSPVTKSGKTPHCVLVITCWSYLYFVLLDIQVYTVAQRSCQSRNWVIKYSLKIWQFLKDFTHIFFGKRVVKLPCYTWIRFFKEKIHYKCVYEKINSWLKILF